MWPELVCSLVLTVTVTAYAPSAGGTNCGGVLCLTALGEQPGPHVAACGPAWPLGTRFWIPGYGRVRCGDRYGQPPWPTSLEVWMPSRADAIAWGVKRLPVCRLISERGQRY